MIQNTDGHTTLAAHPTLTATGKRAIQLILSADRTELGFQITEGLLRDLAGLLDDPKD